MYMYSYIFKKKFFIIYFKLIKISEKGINGFPKPKLIYKNVSI